MPKYAKGSLERSLYLALKKESADNAPKKRLLARDFPPVKSPVEKSRVIVQLSRLYDMGFMSPETLMLVVSDVIKGD